MMGIHHFMGKKLNFFLIAFYDTNSNLASKTIWFKQMITSLKQIKMYFTFYQHFLHFQNKMLPFGITNEFRTIYVGFGKGFFFFFFY